MAPQNAARHFFLWFWQLPLRQMYGGTASPMSFMPSLFNDSTHAVLLCVLRTGSSFHLYYNIENDPAISHRDLCKRPFVVKSLLNFSRSQSIVDGHRPRPNEPPFPHNTQHIGPPRTVLPCHLGRSVSPRFGRPTIVPSLGRHNVRRIELPMILPGPLE